MLISVAMMVKDEEKNLERCLKSVLNLFPLGIEIIILDTGSSDKTVEIAQKYTRNVYHQKWVDNFSLHRNKSFSYCKGKWILQIDADEEIIFPNKENIKKLGMFLEKIPNEINAIGMPMKDWRESIKSFIADLDIIRIFRNGHVKYKRRVHNDPVFKGDAAYFGGCFLKHYGYDLNSEQKKKKAERTITLLKKSLEEDPEDYECYFYLANAYGAWTDQTEEAVKYAKMYIAARDKIDPKNFRSNIYHYLAMVSIGLKKYNEALGWVSQGLEIDREDLDLNYDLMRIGLRTNNVAYVGTGSAGFIKTYRNFKNYRMRNPGKFFFFYNVSALAEAMFHLIQSLMTNALMEYKNIEEVLNQCPQKLANEIKQRLSNTFKEVQKETQKYDDRRIITPAEFKSVANNRNQMLQ